VNVYIFNRECLQQKNREKRHTQKIYITKKQLTEVGGTSESIMKVLSNKFQNNTRNSQKIESTKTLTT
jgi:hypothetical protein